jgi:rare lipoprotein A
MSNRPTLRRLLILVAGAALLGGCAETELASHTAKVLVRDDPAGGRLPADPVPSGYKLGKPYQVAGVTYYPYHDSRFVEQGIASWYGAEFHGRNTANGEPFDMNGVTAAHKTLPLPSTVRVSNLENGRSILVRVNDRGPFVNGRVIDLSRRAAQLLGVYGPGTAKVRVEFVEFAPLHYGSATAIAQREQGPIDSSPSRSASATVATIEASPIRRSGGLIASAEASEPAEVVLFDPRQESSMFVQVGAFASRDNADRLKGTLLGMGDALVQPINVNGRVLYRVRFGPIASLDAADSLLDRLIRSGHTEARLVVENE